MKDKKVLLLRRFNTGYQDGNYSFPAGHVDEGESVADTLVREAKEEIGVGIKKKDINLAHVMHRKGTSQSDERLDACLGKLRFQGREVPCGGLRKKSWAEAVEYLAGRHKDLIGLPPMN